MEQTPINIPFIWDVVRELNELDSWDGQIRESSLEKVSSCVSTEPDNISS